MFNAGLSQRLGGLVLLLEVVEQFLHRCAHVAKVGEDVVAEEHIILVDPDKSAAK
jgi:hypothetical protein